jgi:hypothetical protein
LTDGSAAGIEVPEEESNFDKSRHVTACRRPGTLVFDLTKALRSQAPYLPPVRAIHVFTSEAIRGVNPDFIRQGLSCRADD